jgi:DNA-binding protein H-NS
MTEETPSYETPVTYIRLKQELAEAEAKAKDLEKELAAVRMEARNSLVSNILTSIADHGFDRDEIIELLGKKPKGKAKAKAASTGQRFHDPQVPGQFYVKGALPAWMKQRMVELEMDPNDALHRKHYREHYLQPVE